MSRRLTHNEQIGWTRGRNFKAGTIIGAATIVPARCNGRDPAPKPYLLCTSAWLLPTK